MHNEQTSRSKELQTLTEANEALLRSKSRLQADIIELKKNFVDQAKNLKLIEDLRAKISALNIELDNVTNERDNLISEYNNSLLNIETLKSQGDDLKQQLQQLTTVNSELQQEIARVQNITWLQKLFGRK